MMAHPNQHYGERRPRPDDEKIKPNWPCLGVVAALAAVWFGIVYFIKWVVS